MDNLFPFHAIIKSTKNPKPKMLYEPSKTKKYILIGAAVIVLAVLAIVVIPLLFKDKTIQTPTANIPKTSQKQKIQKQSQKLDQIREGAGINSYTPEELERQSKKLDELRNQMVK